MNIRSVTIFTSPTTHPANFTAFIAAAPDAFHVPVQSVRVAAPPLPDWASSPADALDFVAAWQAVGTAYVNIGTILLRHDTTWLNALPNLIGNHDALFASAAVADQEGHIDHDRAHHLARIVQQLSHTHNNGFGNLYFTVTANCPPESPFFPVGFSAGREGFALALESADVAREAIQAATTLAEARQNLVERIEQETAVLTQHATKLSKQFNLPFIGIDFSLAPFPSDDKSLGGALEDLGLSTLGDSGSLFAAAFVTEALQWAQFPRCGFNGLMLPVLEDSILAQRAADGSLDLQKLLLYSAVCGVGLDTIPLPGDTSESQLAAIFLDLAALATRLNKPLTARLMPIPNHQAGDPLAFNFPFFANGNVMSVSGDGAQGLIANAGKTQLSSISDLWQ